MAQDDSSALLIVLVAGIAVVGMVLSASTLYTHNTFGGMLGGGGGGMMDGGTITTQTTGPGPLEWTILIVSVALFAGTLFLVFRLRSAKRDSPATLGTPSRTPIPDPSVQAATVAAPTSAPEEPVDELTLLKLLDEDEKRMYLEIREHGGTMFQKDIVGLGVFSKAKVTRVLDKLETKGIVVREAHGMTNRVRIVAHPQR